ncbi:hypothetical protein TARUN_5096 [Trichoderma arundinaceum]|uniref:Uncharacterized protein n=1 Tax=Trichoderma arundinaceum TaxID=490622 RepID=A0A395NLZ7_TRIAR|nr:hypothetical protein TARUN_5096 [Trichoderma arundinaceum]
MSDTTELESCPEPPVLKRSGFQLCDGVFSVESVGRISGSRLHELFNPLTLRLKRDQRRAGEESRQLFRKPFFCAAQLRYYGIPFPSSASDTDLSLLLKKVVREGRCNQVPESVIDLEALMCRDYEPLRQKWESDCAAWRAAKKLRDDEAFENCKTPVEKANLDLDRFMDLYFLTDGKPDPNKTPEPLVLDGLDQTWKMQHVVYKIPGLHTSSCDMMEKDRTLCVEWDREKVFKFGSDMMARALAADKALRQVKWEQQLELHQAYLSSIQPKESIGGADENPEPFSLDRCQGSYVIYCEEIMDGWTSDITGHNFTMDISSGKGNAPRAAINLGIIRGHMIFSLSKDVHRGIPGATSFVSETSLGDGEGEEAEDADGDDEHGRDDIEQQESTTGMKRKQGEVPLAQPLDSALHRRANAKRRKTTSPSAPSHRVYFRLHGYETGEGEVFPYPDAGHINFLSSDCIAFEGVVYNLTGVGDNVEFRGYKVSDVPQMHREEEGVYPYEMFKEFESE